MKLQLFSIHDIKTGVFNSPMAYVNEAACMRALRSQFSKPGSIIHECPKDFRLYHIGEFSDPDGVIIPKTHPKMISEMSDILKKDKDKE
jgi:hypothetical protein